MDSLIVKKVENGVATLKLNRPDVRNAFNDEVISLFEEYLKELSKDTSVRVLIIEGEGKAFCAGADLNWMKMMKDYSLSENYNDSTKLAHLFYSINSFPQPVIVKVHGAAIGGGVGLVACGDIVIAQKDSKFAFSEVKLGLIPAVISPFVIKKIGENHARRFFITGELFSASKAKSIGLIHEIVDGIEELNHSVAKMAELIIKNGPEAVISAKSLIFSVQKIDNKNEMIDHTSKQIAKHRISDEGQEGMTALLEKRQPQFKEI